MMKTRIISALVAIALLFAVLLCPFGIVLALAVAAAAAIAVWELLYATRRITNGWVVGGCMTFAAVEVMTVYVAQCELSGVFTSQPTVSSVWQMPVTCLIPIIPLVLFTLFIMLYTVRTYANNDINASAYAYWMTLYATIGFSSVAALRQLHPSVGITYVLLAMVIPWMSDTGAYFIGTFFGKHKMSPVISPKKSWEGFFGGWAVSVVCSALYAVICNAFLAYVNVSPIAFAIMAFVLAPLSVCGDLFASVIKRQSGIKDYGNIMPGHGGVMDRFDSVICIAPILYLLIQVLSQVFS